MAAGGKGETVVDVKAGGAPALYPVIIEAAERSKGRVGAGPLENDREGGQGLGTVRRTE